MHGTPVYIWEEAFLRNCCTRGVTPLRPELGAIAAGRMVLRELNRLVEARAEFAFEITLSGLHDAKRLEDWKSGGYLIEIVLHSTRVAAAGVEQGRQPSKAGWTRCPSEQM